MEELQRKYPKKYKEYQENYNIWKQVTEKEYIKEKFKRDRFMIIVSLIIFIIIYTLILLTLIYCLKYLYYRNNYNNVNTKLTNLNNVSNYLGERICTDKNMSYYKTEFDNNKIYINCNKEVIILIK